MATEKALVCPKCERRFSDVERQSQVCIHCGVHVGGVRCTAGHLHDRSSEANRCDQERLRESFASA